MSSLKSFYLSSIKEFRKTTTIAFLGVMAAIAVVLGSVASINVGPYIKIGFSAVPNRIVDATFGPVVGGIFGGTLDIVKFLVKPDGTFFFGFTFDAMLAGVIFGSIMYRHPLSVGRLFVAELLLKVIINCGFNTFWISMLGGKNMLALLPARLIKNACQLPVDTFIMYLLLKYLNPAIRKYITHER